MGAFQVAVAEDAFEKVFEIVAPLQFPLTSGFQLPGGTAGLFVLVHPLRERLDCPPGLTVVGLAERLLVHVTGAFLIPKFRVVLEPRKKVTGSVVVATYPAGKGAVTV